MQRLSVPRRDNALLGWAKHFLGLISESWASLGLTEQNVTDFGALLDAYAAGIAKCDPNIRSKTFVAGKNAARESLRKGAKLLTNIINGQPDVSDAQKVELGLSVPRARVATPTPPSDPVIQIASVSNHTIAGRLLQSGEDTGLRGRPSHASGAVLFSFVGDEPPASLREWTFERLIGRTRFEMTFDNALPPGTKVWLSAAWFNHRKELGPPCAPVGTNLQGGGVQVTGSMRMAA